MVKVEPGCRYTKNLIYLKNKTTQSAAEPEYKNLTTTMKKRDYDKTKT